MTRMFFRPMSSGMTRCSICPSVSSVCSDPPLEQGATASGEFQPFTQLQGVVVRDDDLGALEIAQHVARHQLTAGVVTIRVIGLEHAQAITDGQTGCDDQETARERLAVG